MKVIQLLDKCYRVKDILSAEKLKSASRNMIVLKLDTVNGKYNEAIDYSDWYNPMLEVQKIDQDFERLQKAMDTIEEPENIIMNPVEVLMAEELKELKPEFENFSVVDIIDYYRKEMESMLRWMRFLKRWIIT